MGSLHRALGELITIVNRYVSPQVATEASKEIRRWAARHFQVFGIEELVRKEFAHDKEFERQTAMKLTRRLAEHLWNKGAVEDRSYDPKTMHDQATRPRFYAEEDILPSYRKMSAQVWVCMPRPAKLDEDYHEK